ncbi:hypothetical protein SAMN04488168_1412 [Bacillus sp. 491mf]|nr:hypothetical protein SAMN04488168_1412 [Bacillus sp. 491mf]
MKSLTFLFSIVLLRMFVHLEPLSLKYTTIQLEFFVNANKFIKLMTSECFDFDQLRRRVYDARHLVSNLFFKNGLYS